MDLGALLKRRGLLPKEFLGAFPAGHRHSAKKFVYDNGLALKLLKKAQAGCVESRKALEFITKFNNEYYKGVYSKDGSGFVNTKEERKVADHDRYARRMDVMSKEHLSVDIVVERGFTEDELIAIIDLKIEREKSKPQ